MLYHLSHTRPLFKIFLLTQGLVLPWPELASNLNPPASASWVAGIIDVNNHAQLHSLLLVLVDDMLIPDPITILGERDTLIGQARSRDPECIQLYP